MANTPLKAFTGELDAEPSSLKPFSGALDGESGGTASDLGKSIKVGAQRLPGMAAGLLDLPFALAAGARPVTKAADALGEATGFQPGKWADETKFSPAYEQGKANIDKAWKDGSAGDIALSYLQNPAYTANQVVESVPSMVAGGLAGRALMGVGRVAAPLAKAGGVGPAAPGLLARTVGEKLAAPLAGGIGEGAVTAGQQMQQYQGEDQQKNAVAALGAGVGTAALGFGAGRVANKMGLETAETAIINAGRDGAVRAADNVPMSAKRRILSGMVSEGVLQELPQSVQEQMWQNYADGKPLTEGIERAGVEGALAGAVMGAGANVSDGGANKRAKQQTIADRLAAEAESAAAQDAALPPTMDTIAGDLINPVNREPATFADLVTPKPPQELDPYSAWEQQASASQAGTAPIPNVEPQVAPSVAMGINPSNGALSKAAAMAVDTGIAQEAQFLGATGRELQPRRTGPGVTNESNVIDVQGRVIEDRAIATPRRLTDQQDGMAARALGGKFAAQSSATRDVVPAQGAPMNLRESRLGMSALKPEGANAQAAAQATPTPAPAIPTAGPAAVETAGPVATSPTTGVAREPSPDQAVQASTQPAQTAAATPAAEPAPGNAGAPAPAGTPEVRALTYGPAPTNPGAQSSPAPGAQGAAPSAAPAAGDRPNNWRTSMLGAKPVAKALGIDPTGKRLAQVVAEIDARDTQMPVTPAQSPAAAPGPIRIGRDQTPLSEGGKPFKTRKAAGDAKKLQPMMRVVTVPGGYALAEKTPAQLAAEERASRRLRNPNTSARGEPIPAHAFIAAAGGLNRVAASDMGVDGNPRIGNRTLFAGQGRGLSMDQATQMLIQDGYLSEGASINDALALVKTSLTRPQYNADGIERIAEAEVQARFEDYLAAQEEASAEGDADPFGMADSFTAEELDEVGYTDADPALQAEVAALITQAEAIGIDTFAILEDIARTYANATQDQYNAAARDALAQAIARSNQDGGSTAAQAAPAAESSAEQGLNQPEALGQQAPAATENVAPAVSTTVDMPPTRQQESSPFARFATGRYRISIRDEGSGPYAEVVAIQRGNGVEIEMRMPGEALGHPAFSQLNARAQALFETPTSNMFDAEPGTLELESLAPAEAAAQQAAQEQAAKAETARQRAADAQAARDDERKRIAQASVRAADNFELGQDPLDSLTGQGSIFDAQDGKGGQPMFSRKGAGGITPEQRAENFARWSDNAPLISSEHAEAYDFKTGQKIVVEAFHGSARPDRIGGVFDPKRATSGPMAYFTSSPELASSYAKGKEDTSLADEDQSYANWFKFKPPGARSAVSIDRAWNSLTPEAQARIRKLAPQIAMDDTGENIVIDPDNTDGLGNYGWELRQARGNPLAALVESWLSSGTLFNEETKFMDVLRMAGFPVAGVEMDFPNAAYPGVFKTYVSMKNPLVVGDMPADVRAALEQAAKADRTKAKPGADMWDKRSHTLRDWWAKLNDPDPQTAAYAWTSIPDKVTDVLKAYGYDGIVDWSGKGGGHQSPVYIPFGPTQVKSVFNRGTFDPTKKDISFGRGANAAIGTPAATIRAAITKAYGKLLGQLESKGLVTLTQTLDQAIEAAAQARAAKTGQSVEQARAALRASVKNSVADQTQTENFKRWFKDSKAVDADGKPLVVYHGTRREFSIFEPMKPRAAYGNPVGIYFTDDINEAKEFAEDIDGATDERSRVVHAYLSIQSDADGIIRKRKDGTTEYIVFKPEKIKSATGNQGTFDSSNPDIRRSADGSIQGFFDPQTGQSFLVADNLTAEAAPGVLMHEVGIHMAADGSMKALFNRAAMMLKMQRGNPFIKAVQARMDAAGETSGEEAAAYIAEAYENDRANAPASVQRWLSDLLAAVKAWMFKKGIMGADRLTVADIAAVARANARSMARDGGATGGRGFGPAFSRAPAGDQTQTEAFKRWFKGSKAVDADGKPLVVYHGTGADIEVFNVSERGEFGGGIYLTPDTKGASDYATYRGQGPANVMPVYVSIKNPASAAEASQVASWKGEENAQAELIRRGYDGVIDMRSGQVVAFRPEQVKSAIGNRGTFDPTNPDIRFSRAATTVATDYTPTQQAAAEKAFGTIAKQTLAERAQAFRANMGTKLRQGLVDQFAPIKEVSQQAYMLARMSKGSDGAVEAALLYGKPFLRDGVTDVNMQDGGFANVLASLKGEHDRFFQWVAAQRAERLKAEGKENLLTDTDIAALRSLNAGKMADGTVRMPLYAKALQELNAFNEASLKVALESGLIDQAAYDLMRDQPYVPFYRLMEEGDMRGPRFSSGLTNQQAWKKLKGGTQQLNADLLQNTLLNWSHLYAAAARNRAALATMTEAENLGIAYQVPADTKGSVKVMRDGVAEHWMVEDPYLLEAISALNYTPGGIVKALAPFKRLLTFGVTVNPTFKIRSLTRDSLSAIAQSDLSYNPAENVAKGWKATSKDSQTYASMLASGGIIKFGTQENTNYLRGQIERLGGTMLDKQGWEKFTGQMRSLWETYEEFGDRTENVNRAALYERLRAKGLSHAEASFQARDLMDFSMSGKWEAVRFLTQTVPFLNARLQGLYKLGRAAKEDPRRFAAMAGAVSMASLALLAAYSDDEDWKKREDWDRDNFWWFKVGEMAFRIPKPFEVGAIGTVAERTAELMLSDEMTGKRFGQRISDMVFNTFAMDPTPQAIKPFLDVYANKDSFSGRAIEGMADERLRPQDRYNERTSEVARLLGSWGLPDPVRLAKGEYAGLSPKQIDFLLRGYFGWLATVSNTAMDAVARPLLGRGERPEARLRDAFLAGNFVESLPSGSSRYVTAMYEQARDVEQAWASYQAAIKSGDIEKAREIQQDEAPKLRSRMAIENAKSQIADLNARAKRIEADRLMSAQAKRVKLDEIEALRNRAAERVAVKN